MMSLDFLKSYSAWALFVLAFCIFRAHALALDIKCRQEGVIGWRSVEDQYAHFLQGFDLLRGPSSISGWPIFRLWTSADEERLKSANSTVGCRTGKSMNRHGQIVDVMLPSYIDQLDVYAEPSLVETGLITYNSSWQAYVDWRKRRTGFSTPIRNETSYKELYAVIEYPFRTVPFKYELERYLEDENRFFRLVTAAVTGTLAFHPRNSLDLDENFVEYVKSAMDGEVKLRPLNEFYAWKNGGEQIWNAVDDIKTHNWNVIFNDAYGTHYATSIKFGHVFDVRVSRATCTQQTDAKMSDLAQCYFAETKLNLTVSGSGSRSGPNVDVCPHLKPALRDLRARFTHPSGYTQSLTDAKRPLSDFLKRIREDARHLWKPTIVEAKLAPICELVSLVRPNDLDVKVECEENLLRYLRMMEPVEDQRKKKSLLPKFDQPFFGDDLGRVTYEDKVFMISTKLSDYSCPETSGTRCLYRCCTTLLSVFMYLLVMVLM